MQDDAAEEIRGLGIFEEAKDEPAAGRGAGAEEDRRAGRASA